MDKTLGSYDIIYADSDNLSQFSASYDLSRHSITGNCEELIDILHPENTRWFFRSTMSSENNLFCPFNGYDSLRLETKFRELSVFKGDYTSDSKNEKIIVKSDLFEADVIKRICEPIYWTDSDDNLDIFRGTWFLSDTYEPLVECLADAIESQYIMNFLSLRYNCLDNSSRERNYKVIHSLIYDDYVIEWYDLNEAYLYYTKSVAYRMKLLNVSNHMNFGQRIMRGYKDKSRLDDKPLDISHLCFVVHGIGQRLTGHINRQCNKLKRSCKRVLKKYYSLETRSQFRIEFLPIEWRISLNLDGGIVDSITPKEFKGLRTIFNNTVMDILYYSSSLYRIEMAHGVQSELNRIYSMFCSRNPYFENRGGKLSIIAHSLGSVICYDIISSWGNSNIDLDNSLSLMVDRCDNSAESRLKFQNEDTMTNKVNNNDYDLKNTQDFYNVKLPSKGYKQPNFPSNFKIGNLWKEVNNIENFFMLGSPLPVFLALRGINPENIQDEYDILPKMTCKKIFNIYHNSDPVAYRIEPLFFKEYLHLDPVHINPLKPEDEIRDNVKKQKHLRFAFQQRSSIPNNYESTHSDSEGSNTDEFNGTDTGTNPIKDRIAQTFRRLSRATSILPPVDELQLKFKSLKEYSFLKRFKVFLNILKGKDTDENENIALQETFSHSEYRRNLKLRHRLDYTLGEESGIGSYISLLTSHTSYWEDMNLAKFLIDQVIEQS